MSTDDTVATQGIHYAHNHENQLSRSVHIWELGPDESTERGGRTTMRSVCKAGMTYQELRAGLPDLDADSTCGNCARIVRARRSTDTNTDG